MSPRPKSLGLKDRRPARAVWVCDRHGELEPGETECARCTEDGER